MSQFYCNDIDQIYSKKRQPMKKKRNITVAILALMLITGCTPVPKPNLPENEEMQETSGRMWDDTQVIERHYKLRPEPYSLDSKQKDPELLGPQTTLKNHPLARNDDTQMEYDGSSTATDAKNETQAQKTETADTTSISTVSEKSVESVQTAAKPAMDRGRCISMIGQSKFDKYTTRFGSEAAAIRRCAMLEKAQ